MTRTPETDQAPLLGRAHRMIRVLDNGDGPFPGALVTDGDTVAVARDAVALGGWEAWRFAGSEHVAAPMDLVRRADGHDVLLPWCTERVGVFVGRRAGAGEPLTPGESSTLVVSLLRALAELGANDCTDVRGTWWLTDEGRPVFVIGEGEPARAEVTSLVMRLGEQNRDRALGRLLAVMHEGLGKSVAEHPGIPPLLLDRWENEMLEIASPRALRRDVLAPEPAQAVTRPGTVGRLPVPPRRVASRVRARSGARARSSRLVTTFRQAASDLVERTVRVIAPIIRRRHSTARRAVPMELVAQSAEAVVVPTSRRRPLVLAGAAAAVVLAVGVLWPSDGDDDAAAGNDRMPAATSSEKVVEPLVATPTSSATAVDEAVTNTNASNERADTAVDDPVQAAAVLWEEAGTCRKAEDAVCDRATVPGAVGVIEALDTGLKTPPVFAMIDQYGDIAVVRAEQVGGEPSQESGEGSGEADAAAPIGKVLVLARLNEKWLIRDAYDVADQPG
ncbi:hypothetical protein [Microbacterium oxydans]|uniref:hypothetical protein n=1 Tax=Microbacterium oxydans TaxID=82380 RepID=UPI001E32B181|nr:hypothetical protein [Microbacterium oxydans]